METKRDPCTKWMFQWFRCRASQHQGTVSTRRSVWVLPLAFSRPGVRDGVKPPGVPRRMRLALFPVAARASGRAVSSLADGPHAAGGYLSRQAGSSIAASAASRAAVIAAVASLLRKETSQWLGCPRVALADTQREDHRKSQNAPYWRVWLPYTSWHCEEATR